MIKRESSGTTLPEVIIALVIASIVAIGYSSMLMYTRNMYNDSVVRSQLSKDAYVIDQYVRSKLTLQLTDSLKIYADSTAENEGTTSNSGTVLRSVRPDTTVDHLAVQGTKLTWKINSNPHYPVDSDVSSILFSRRSGYSTTMLDITMWIKEESDSLRLDWLVSIRN